MICHLDLLVRFSYFLALLDCFLEFQGIVVKHVHALIGYLQVHLYRCSLDTGIFSLNKGTLFW